MAPRNTDGPEDQRITYRIGINIGDIIVEGDDIYGDGVNVAARMEGLAVVFPRETIETLETQDPTIADLIKEQGYVTGQFGKIARPAQRTVDGRTTRNDDGTPT